ncbi:ATP-grasp domain-containing protein [Dickeya chrysanthemi]|uniref:ATP-grasp domain-containing protein n=1 Tax=Dickeya chrysanthemi TaxID=556 RepID=UPI003018CD45
MNAILIVDPLSAGERYILAAKNLGYQVLVLLTRAESLYKNLHASYASPNGYFHEQVEKFICVNDIKEAIEKLAPYKNNIKAVIPGSDAGVELADHVASALDLPSNYPDLAMARRDKGMMKDAVSKAGLRVAQYKRVDNLTSGLSFSRQIGYPVVVKTPTGAASFNVFICNSDSDFEIAFLKIIGNYDPFQRKQNDCIIEEFINGTEYVVNLFANGNDIYVTDIWQYRKTKNQYASNLYQDTFTVECNDPRYAALKEYAKGVVKATGIKYGPVHGEFFIDAKGPVMVEIGARPAGLGMATIFADTGAFDVFTETVLSYLGNQEKEIYDGINNHPVWIVSIPNTESGTLLGIEGLDNISNINHYFSHSCSVKIGEYISPTVDLLTLPISIWLTGAPGFSLESVADTIRKRISYKVNTD